MSLTVDISSLKHSFSVSNVIDHNNFDKDLELEISSTVSENSSGKRMGLFKRISSFWRGGKSPTVSDRYSENDRNSFSKSPSHLYKLTASIQHCRYRNGYRETMYKCAQECNAYYSKDGKLKSIYFEGESLDLIISLLFPSYGDAKQFQNILLNLNSQHPLYHRKVVVEKRIVEELSLKGFYMPEKIMFDDYLFDENNDSMPFLSAVDILENSTRYQSNIVGGETKSEIKGDNNFDDLESSSVMNMAPESSNITHLHVSGNSLLSFKNSSRNISNGISGRGVHGMNMNGIMSGSGNGRSTSPLSISSVRDDETSTQRSMSTSVTGSIRSDYIRPKSIIRIDSDPSRTLQSLENLSTNLKLKCYCCHIVSNKMKEFRDDPDNAIYGTWLFRQYFDGLIKDGDIPEVAINFVSTGGEEKVNIGGMIEMRTKVNVSIHFRDSSLALALSKQFKEGTRRLVGEDIKFYSFLYARNAKNMEYFLDIRYNSTIRMWEEDSKSHLVDDSQYGGGGFDDDSFC